MAIKKKTAKKATKPKVTFDDVVDETVVKDDIPVEPIPVDEVTMMEEDEWSPYNQVTPETVQKACEEVVEVAEVVNEVEASEPAVNEPESAPLPLSVDEEPVIDDLYIETTIRYLWDAVVFLQKKARFIEPEHRTIIRLRCERAERVARRMKEKREAL